MRASIKTFKSPEETRAPQLATQVSVRSVFFARPMPSRIGRSMSPRSSPAEVAGNSPLPSIANKASPRTPSKGAEPEFASYFPS